MTKDERPKKIERPTDPEECERERLDFVERFYNQMRASGHDITYEECERNSRDMNLYPDVQAVDARARKRAKEENRDFGEVMIEEIEAAEERGEI